MSQPKAVTLGFLTAIDKADAAGAKRLAVGTDQEMRWIDATVAMIDGLRKYDQALLNRFGRDAIPIDVELQQVISSMTSEPLMKFQGGVAKEEVDTAEVYPALNGVRLASQSPMLMRRVNGLWKVDLSAMQNDPKHNPELVRQYLAAGKAVHKAAQEIRKGRYKTLDAAENAVGS